MAHNGMPGSSQSPLLEDTVAGAVDRKGLPAKRSTSGGWSSVFFIIGSEAAERSAYHGIEGNLVNYLTGPLGQSTAMAAKNVNTWFGITTLLPLLGAFVADSYLGRYRTILIASLLYILALGLLTMSATLSSHNPLDFRYTEQIMSSSSSPSQLQVILFFVSLYIVAVAEGGHKPCAQAFGADQFDGEDPMELKAKSSYFNWLNFSLSIGISVSVVTISYVQDKLSWALGFGIPCIMLVVALLLFLAGTNTYRYSIRREENNAFGRISKVFVEAAKNWRLSPSSSEKAIEESQYHQCSPKFKFLNKALLGPKFSQESGNKACSIGEVEEAKAILRLFPIWSTCLIYAMVIAQSSTFFTKQGTTMDRSIGSGFDITSASLKSFINITVVLFVPIYDLVFVPIARNFTEKPSGITMLQRIGIGIFLSTIAMAIAALVENKRLRTAQEHGLVDMPNATIPMRVWWLVPQYVLFGLAGVFAYTGLEEFFYDQVPNELRSIGISLFLSILGVGSFLSSFLIHFLEKITGRDGRDSWFNDNLNKAHLDHFYWLLFGIDAIGLVAFLHFARSYIYNRRGVS